MPVPRGLDADQKRYRVDTFVFSVFFSDNIMEIIDVTGERCLHNFDQVINRFRHDRKISRHNS